LLEPFLVALTAATFIAGVTVLAPVALEAASASPFATAKLIAITIASAELTTVASAELIPLAAAKLTTVAPAEIVPLTSAELTSVTAAKLVQLAAPATITFTSVETIRPAPTLTATLATAEFFATTEVFATAEVFATTALVSTQHAEHREPPLLAVVEALVERVGSVGQFLQRSTGFRQDLCTPAQALGRIHVIALLPLAAPSDKCIDALKAQLGEFAGRLLEGWPVPFLVGRQHETRAQRTEPRFRESTHVLDVCLPAPELRPALALLRIDQGRTCNHESGGTGKDRF
jgi:hypothetical protein